MIKRLFTSVSEHDKQNAITEIIRDSSPRPEFYFMIILGMVLGTIGLYLDNAAIVIGSMLLTPVMAPMVATALGLAISDYELIGRSTRTSLRAIGLSVATAIVVSAIFFSGTPATTQQILLSAQASLPFLIVAIAAGCAVAFALVKPNLSASLPGVAVSVALVPPLAALGIGISKFDWDLTTGALEQLLLNVFGVLFASIVVFQLMNFYIEKSKIDKAVERDEQAMEHQKAAEEASTKGHS